MDRKMNTNAREKRPLMKMVSRYELKEELDKVNGGIGYHEEVDDTGNRYCKYCNAYTPAIDLGIGKGWENGHLYPSCRIFKCKLCNQDTYWTWCNNYYLE